MEPLGGSSFAATLSNLPTSLSQALPSVWKRAASDASQFDRSPDREALPPRSSGYNTSRISSPTNVPSRASHHGRASFTSLGSSDAHVISAVDAALDEAGSPRITSAPHVREFDATEAMDRGHDVDTDGHRILAFLRMMQTTPFHDMEAVTSQLMRENGALRASLSAEARDNEALRREVASVRSHAEQVESVNERLRKDNERLQAQLYEWRMDRWDVAVAASPPVPATSIQPSTNAPAFIDALPMSAAAEFMSSSTAAIARARQALPTLPTLQSFTTAMPSMSGMLPSWASPARDESGSDVAAASSGEVEPAAAIVPAPRLPQPTTKAAIARVLELVDAAQACLTTGDEAHMCVSEATVARMEDVLLALCLVSDQLHFALSARVSLMKSFDSNAPMHNHAAGDAVALQPVAMEPLPLALSSADTHGSESCAVHPLPALDMASHLMHETDGVIPSPAAFDAMKRMAQDAVRRASLTAAATSSPRPRQPSNVVLADAAYPPGARRDVMQSAAALEPDTLSREPLAMLPLEASPLHTRFTLDDHSDASTYCPLEVLRGQPHMAPKSPPSALADSAPAAVLAPTDNTITVKDATSHADEPAATTLQDMSATLTVHALEKVAADAADDDAAPLQALPSNSDSRRSSQSVADAHSWSLESLHLPPKLASRLRAARRTSAGLPHPLLNSFGPGRGLRILCLDGGGIRGLLMLECLKKLEADCGHRVVDMFDLVCGTSTGGFLSVALSMRKSLEDIAREYERIRSTVGGQSSILSEVKRFATGTSHDHLVAEQTLQAFFGTAKMNELPISPKVAVVCAAVNFTPAQPYLFRSYELTQEAFASAEILGTSNVSAATAVRATTSAPTYYAPAVVGTERMVDGAILANNPALIAMSEAALLWPGARIDALVSLGTGTQSLRPNTAASVMTWVRTVLELSLSSHMTHKITSTLLGDRYFRFDPETAGDVDLVEVRLDVLARMLEEGRRYIHRMSPEFARLKRVLVP